MFEHEVARNALTGSQKDEPCPGDVLVRSDCEWSVRLLQKVKTAHLSRGLSVLELRPHTDGGHNCYGGASSSQSCISESTMFGSMSAILHVLSSPICFDFDADLVGATSVEPFLRVGRSAASSVSPTFWKQEAQRVFRIARALNVSSSKGPLTVALLFAVSISVKSQAPKHVDLTRYVDHFVSQWLAANFTKAFHAESSGGCAITCQAFCVAVQRQHLREREKGFVGLSHHLSTAATWALCNGARPYVVPTVRSLRLPQRILGYLSRNLLASSRDPAFPYSLRELAHVFEAAVDACSADLDRLMLDLSSWPLEWKSTLRLDEQCEHVGAVRRMIWKLRPPLEMLVAYQTPFEFWDAVRQFLQSSQNGDIRLSEARAACPDWWAIQEPMWDDAVLRVTAGVSLPPTRISVSLTGAVPDRDLFGMNQPEPVRCGSVGIEVVRDRLTVADGSAVSVSSHTDSVQTVRAKRKQSLESAVSRSVSQRRCSFAEVLRRDRTWADRLLSGVALLAVKLPAH